MDKLDFVARDLSIIIVFVLFPIFMNLDFSELDVQNCLQKR